MNGNWPQWLAEPDPGLDVALKLSALLALAWLVHFGLRGRNPRWRALLWRGTAVGAVLVPFLAFLMPPIPAPVLPPAKPPATEAAPTPVGASLGATMAYGPDFERPNMAHMRRPRKAPGTSIATFPQTRSWTRDHPALLIGLFWGAGVLVWVALAVRGGARMRRVVKGAAPAPEIAQRMMRIVAQGLGVRRPPELRRSPAVASPILAGLIRPVVLLPERMANSANEDDWPAVFAHELSHLKTHDLLWTRALQGVSILLWLHPLTWGLRRAHGAACEAMSDAAAADYVGGVESYSGTLARVALAVAGRRVPLGALPMARKASIRVRLELLKRAIYSMPLSRRRVGIMMALGFAMVAALGGLRLTSRAAEGAAPEAAKAPAKSPVERELEALTDQAIRAENSKDYAKAADLYRRILAKGEKELGPSDSRLDVIRVMLANAEQRIAQGPGDAAPVAQLANARVLHFPRDRSLGMLDTQDASAQPEIESYYYWIETDDWAPAALAQGDVVIPEGKRVRLRLHKAAVARRLAGLEGLAPDDLHGIVFPFYEDKDAAKADDRAVALVGRLTGLKQLDLQYCGVSDRGLGFLKNLGALERLWLPESITNTGIMHMPKLKNLTWLCLRACRVDRAGWNKIADMFPGLQTLGISGNVSRAFDADLAPLARLTSLWYLHITANHLTDAGLAQVRNIPSLKTLHVSHMPITDAGVAYLAGHPTLERLSLHDTRVTGAGMAHLATIPNLKMLDVAKGAGQSPGRITPEGLSHLKDLTSLESLTVDGEALSDESIACLASLPNLNSLAVLGRTDAATFTAAGLTRLAAMKSLETLHISGPGLTDQGVKALAQSTSLKDLVLYIPWTPPSGSKGTFTSQGLAHLATMNQLTNLEVSGEFQIPITGVNQLNALTNLKRLAVRVVQRDAAVLDLSALTQLEELGLTIQRPRDKTTSSASPRKRGRGRQPPDFNGFTDADTACLAKLVRLKRLEWVKGISDAGMAHLAGLSSLAFFSGGGPGVTDKGLGYLAGLKQMNYLSVEGAFTDQGLRSLEGLRALENLTIKSANMPSIAARERLKRSLPMLGLLQIE